MGGDAKLCSCHLAVTAPPLLTFRAPKTLPGTSLVVQCLYSELPMQGAWVRSLVGKLRFHKQCSATKGKKKNKNLPEMPDVDTNQKCWNWDQNIQALYFNALKRHFQSTYCVLVEKEMATQPTPVFSLGESPRTEETGGLQAMGSQSVRHD